MKNFLMLITGVAIGVGVSWTYHKNKYEQLVEEEVESLREHAKKKEDSQGMTKDEYKKNENNAEDTYEVQVDELEEAKEQAEQIINNSKYTTGDKIHAEEMADRYKHPFIIDKEMVGGLVGFDVGEYHCYEDGIITDDDDEMADDCIEVLGMIPDDIKQYFDDNPDDDILAIRNMKLKSDYEILRELGSYESNR